MVNAVATPPMAPAWREMVRRVASLLLGLVALALSLPPGHCGPTPLPSGPEVQVEVRAEGPDFASARNEAVRQAVQKVLPQVVTADRRIQNDRIVLDEVQSSLNGHVRHIEVLDSGPSPNGVWVRLAVTVGPQAVGNYLNPTAPQAARFSGQALSGEQAREAQAREFREQHVRHLLQGFPAQALQVAVQSIRPADRAPGGLQLQVAYQLQPAFLQRLQQGLQDIACDPRQPAQCARTGLCFDRTGHLQCLTLALGPPGTEYPLIYDAFLEQPHEGYREPPARRHLSFTLLFRFKNQAGRRTGLRPCHDFAVQVDRQSQRMLSIPYTNAQDDSPVQVITRQAAQLGLNTFSLSHWVTDRPVSLVVEIPKQLLEQVDLANSNQIEALAVIQTGSGRLSKTGQEEPAYLFDITQPAVVVSRNLEDAGQVCSWR